MPRNRQTTRKKGNIPESAMRAAILDVKAGTSIRSAAKKHNIPVTTVQRYSIKTQYGNKMDVKLTPNYGVRKIFTNEQEEELKTCIIKYTKEFNGLSRTNYRRLAYEIAVAGNLKIPAQWTQNRMAGLDWFRNFRTRHPELMSLGWPKAKQQEINAKSLVAKFKETYTKPLTSEKEISKIDDSGPSKRLSLDDLEVPGEDDHDQSDSDMDEPVCFKQEICSDDQEDSHDEDPISLTNKYEILRTKSGTEDDRKDTEAIQENQINSSSVISGDVARRILTSLQEIQGLIKGQLGTENLDLQNFLKYVGFLLQNLPDDKRKELQKKFIMMILDET